MFDLNKNIARFDTPFTILRTDQIFVSNNLSNIENNEESEDEGLQNNEELLSAIFGYPLDLEQTQI